MLSGKRGGAKPDAVWHSDRAKAATPAAKKATAKRKVARKKPARSQEEACRKRAAGARRA